MTEDVGEFAAALGDVLANFGRRVVDDPRQLRGALSDTLGVSAASHRAEVDAVVAASQEGVARAIRDADPQVPASPEQVRAWFEQLVSAGVSLRDAALATSSWAEVFRAEGTARVASEVSSQLLGSDPAGAQSSSGVVSSPVVQSVPPVVVAGAGALTDVTEVSRLAAGAGDLTRQHTEFSRLSELPAPPPPPLPAGPAVVQPPQEPPLPPTGPVPVAGAAATPERSGSRWLRVAWLLPAAAALVAIVMVVSNGQSAIAANQVVPPDVAPVEAAALQAPITANDDKADTSGLVTKAEMASMLFTEKQLKSIILKESDKYTWGPNEFVNTADERTIGQRITTKGCTAAMLLMPKGGWMLQSYGSNNGGTDKWVEVYSTGLWFEDAAAAKKAFQSLKIKSSCAKSATMKQVIKPVWSSPAHSRQKSGKAKSVPFLSTTSTLDTSSTYGFARRCYLRSNVVVCYVVAGNEAGRIANSWRGSSRNSKLNAIATKPITTSPFEVME